MARPRKDFDRDTFEKLCHIQATEAEVCEFFGIERDTLNRRCKEIYGGRCFAQVYKEYSAGGKISLRRKQWQLADKNAGMAIFLGKQYLGQRDCSEMNIAHTFNPYSKLNDAELDELIKKLDGVKADGENGGGTDGD